MNHPPLLPRILLIEDDPERIAIFREWTGTNFVLIEASSGGRALGILKRDTAGIAGVCLDNDLEKSPLTDIDIWLSGSGLISAIIHSVPRRVPVLIHSMNAQKPPSMERSLKSAGFSVTRIRMVALTAELFQQWLVEVLDSCEEITR